MRMNAGYFDASCAVETSGWTTRIGAATIRRLGGAEAEAARPVDDDDRPAGARDDAPLEHRPRLVRGHAADVDARDPHALRELVRARAVERIRRRAPADDEDDEDGQQDDDPAPLLHSPHFPRSIQEYECEAAAGSSSVDAHRQAGERLAARGADEPRVLHVEARAAVGADRVRVHREDHVLTELGLDAVADLWVLDHRHPDRVAGDVAEVVAARAEAARDGGVDVVGARARSHRLACGLEVLLVGLEHPPLLVARGAEGAGDLDP